MAQQKEVYYEFDVQVPLRRLDESLGVSSSSNSNTLRGAMGQQMITLPSSKHQEDSVDKLIELVTKLNGLQHPERFHLVIPPSAITTGQIIENDTLIRDLARLKKKKMSFELWMEPNFVNMGKRSSKEGFFEELKYLAIDTGVPLRYMIPTLQQVFSLAQNEEYSFFYVIPTLNIPEEEIDKMDDFTFHSLLVNLHHSYFGNPQWITTKRAMKNQIIPKTAVLVISPVSNLMNRPLSSFERLERMGKLYINMYNKKDKSLENFIQNNWTPKQTRFFALSDAFLLVFKSQEDSSSPIEVIPLEYHAFKLLSITTKAKKALTVILLKRVKPHLDKSDVIILYDNDFDILNEWATVIKPKCINISDTQVFGIELIELMKRESRKAKIPTPIEKVADKMKLRGLTEEGLFRISGNRTWIEAYKQQMDEGFHVDFSKCDIHTMAGLIRLFVRELPEPVIPFRYYDKFMAAAEEKEESVILEKILSLVKLIPIEHFNFLKYLSSFLFLVSTFENSNKMGTRNLSVVFGPSILRSAVEVTSPQEMVESNRKSSVVAKLFMENYEQMHHVGEIHTVMQLKAARSSVGPQVTANGTNNIVELSLETLDAIDETNNRTKLTPKQVQAANRKSIIDTDSTVADCLLFLQSELKQQHESDSNNNNSPRSFASPRPSRPPRPHRPSLLPKAEQLEQDLQNKSKEELIQYAKTLSDSYDQQKSLRLQAESKLEQVSSEKVRLQEEIEKYQQKIARLESMLMRLSKSNGKTL